MADKRMIRDWTTSETMDGLTQGAEIFFTRLIMKADDYGNYVGNIKLIKAALFPLKDTSFIEIGAWIKECTRANLILLYSVDGKEYIHIENFGQKLRRYHAAYPPPPSDGNLPTGDGQVTDKRPPELEVEDEVEEKKNTKAQTFDKIFENAFDEITCDRYKMTFKGLDLGAELQEFKTKCDNSPMEYKNHGVEGLRKAFQYQLKYSKPKKNGTATDNLAEASRIIRGGTL